MAKETSSDEPQSSPTVVRHRFKRQERLKSKKTIGRLFEKNNTTAHAFPIRAVWVIMEGEALAPVQVVFIVAKKKFKRAVDRHRIQRQMREAWRLNKHLLYPKLQKLNKNLAIALIYTGTEELSTQELINKMKLLVEKLIPQKL